MNNWLSKIVTPGFIAANAHIWFAAFVTMNALLWGAKPLTVCSLVAAVAAVKEFYIDKHYERGQTFLDNLTDWSEYVAGALVGVLAAVMHR